MPPSRTCSGATPASPWSACYVYDNDGNLTSKTDNQGITINFRYDAANHLLGRTYSGDATGTALSCYQYGTTSNTTGLLVGRLMNAWTQPPSSGSCAASPPAGGYLTLRAVSTYDPMGRVLNEQQCTPSNCKSGTSYPRAYTYDGFSNLLTWNSGLSTTPSFTAAYDGAGHLSTLVSSQTGPTYPTALFTAQASGAGSGSSAASATSSTGAVTILGAEQSK
jgi:YD repeat-containing protein